MQLLSVPTALLASILLVDSSSAFTVPTKSATAHFQRVGETQLHWFSFGPRKRKVEEVVEEDDGRPKIVDVGPDDFVTDAKPIPRASSITTEEVDVCIIGAGVSGLTAAITAGQDKKTKDLSIKILEASSTFGGRVKSEQTDDGFVLDQGFAVFIEEYPLAKQLLDYDALKLKPFLPGALVKVQGQTRLARVADPLRDPTELISAVLAPVGGLFDKANVLPLIVNARTKSLNELFEEREVDTLTALVERWNFSDDFINKFYKPFLEGIYLAPLAEQSSRMFSFIFKMFSEGSATLPAGGIGQVAAQLAAKAEIAGAEILTDMPVTRISSSGDSFIVECKTKNRRFLAKSLIVATDGKIAQKLLSNVEGFESLADLPQQPQRNVGNLYYGFDTPLPVKEPILVLNGIGEESGTEKFPVNNICFPSAVNDGYAPEGSNLCSVTVLNDAMELYKGRPEELDQAVRQQIGKWFPARRAEILDEWELKKIFYVPNAQPGQLRGPFPASVNGGRDPNTYREKKLPPSLFVCGDHMATATLNGALESGVNAGQQAAQAAAKAKQAAASA